MMIKAHFNCESNPESLRAEARRLRNRADRLDASAVDCYFTSNNTPDVTWRFDLHGYHVSEAEKFVLSTIEDWLSGALGNFPKLKFICGKGNHSPDGIARLLPAIETLLRESRPELIAEVKEGEIVVSMDRSKSRDNLVDLRAKLRTLPFSLASTEDYPCYLHDMIAVEAYEVFRDLAAHCGEYLAENWKGDADTTVRAVELLQKFGIKKPLEDLFVSGRLDIFDNNVEELMRLCKQHSLDEIMSECERYICENWKSRPEEWMAVVELADKLNLPNLAKEFIPLTAKCHAFEIRHWRHKISSEHFDQIEAGFYRYRICDAKVKKYAANPRAKVHAETFLLANWSCPDKVAKAIELCAKHGLDNCLAKLFRDSNLNRRNIITDANIDLLLDLYVSNPWKLASLRADCLQYVTAFWSDKPEMALRAVEIADKMGLPDLAKAFIPKAATRSLAEIKSFRAKVSSKSLKAMVRLFHRGYLNDENIESAVNLLSSQKSHFLLKESCEYFLLKHWKHPEKVAKAVGLSAKFGLDDCLAHLFRDDKMNRCNITDDNVEQLLDLCLTYPKLTALQTDCLQYITETWSDKPERALLAVETAHKMRLPFLADAFIPLAATRPIMDIMAAKLSVALRKRIWLAKDMIKADGWAAKVEDYAHAALANAATAPLPNVTGAVKFIPAVGQDTMMRNNATLTINTRHQCTTGQKEYEMKSLEELRVGDFLAGRKEAPRPAASQPPLSRGVLDDFKFDAADPSGKDNLLKFVRNTNNTCQHDESAGRHKMAEQENVTDRPKKRPRLRRQQPHELLLEDVLAQQCGVAAADDLTAILRNTDSNAERAKQSTAVAKSRKPSEPEIFVVAKTVVDDVKPE